MCLVNFKRIEMGLKKKPITCYKVFWKGDLVLNSPLYNDVKGGCFWKVGETRRVGEDHPAFYDTYRFGMYEPGITGDAFHSCKGIKAAKSFRDWLADGNKARYDNYAIAKCEIPLDSKFAFEGTAVVSDDDEGLPGYVSETIKIVELV